MRLLRAGDARARKQHQCVECLHPIHKGEVHYAVAVAVAEGLYTYRAHIECIGRHEFGCDSTVCGGEFLCARCFKPVGWCFGGSDDDLCNSCWCETHEVQS